MRPKVPAPLGTLFWSLLAVTGIALGALMAEVVVWFAASLWHVVLTVLLAGTVVMASRALKSARHRDYRRQHSRVAEMWWEQRVG